MTRLAIVLGFVLLPVLWGVAVNALFDLWSNDTDADADEGNIFPDYQI